jgi:tetratricopeptide (TPR) repeat protein
VRATRLLTLALALALTPRGVGADVVVAQATLDPPQVRVGEAAALAIELAGAQDAAPPQIPAVEGVVIRYVGPSTQISMVNGRTTASITHRFTVTATRAGTFTIGPLTLEAGGKTYAAGSVTLQAVAAGTARPDAAGGGVGGDQLRLLLSTPRTEVYLHERVPIDLRLLIGSIRVADLQYPTLPGDGFALEKFPEPSQSRETIAGGTFQVFAFRTVLTPLRSGPLAVGPALMGMNLLERARRADPFFGSLFGESRQPGEARSAPLALTVLPLPEANRPADFSGAVGRFDFDVAAGPLALAAGDPVTVTATIRGDGYLESVAPPAIAASDTLRVYPVQPVPPAAGAAQTPPPGERRFEQVVIPQQPGTVTLPALRFSYFDPALRAYRTLTRGPFTLAVHPSAQGQSAPQIVGSTPTRPRPESLGQDIVSIKDAPGALQPVGARRYRSLVFWLVQLVPLAGWAAAVVVDRRRRRLSGDARYARFTRAGRTARAALARARQALAAGDPPAFYDAVARAVCDYLAAKLDLPPGGVTAEAVGACVAARGIPARVGDDVRELLAACEHARFAPTAAAGADMARTLERADAIVHALERARRLGRAVGAVSLLVALAAGAAGESPNTLFFRGNALYGEEHWAEAAAAYERVLSAGLESGALYFNLGNAYFKAGDVGRAVLSYERARQLMPGDPDLQANLGFARHLDDDAGTEETDGPLYARLLVPLAGRFATDTLLLGASVCWTMLLVFLAAARFVPGLARFTPTMLGTAGMALALLVPAAAYRLVTLDLPPRAVVVAPAAVAVRFEPVASGTLHYQARPGTVLNVLAEREGWAQVARRDGRRGWVERSALETL